MIEKLQMMKPEECCREQVWPFLRRYPGIRK